MKMRDQRGTGLLELLVATTVTVFIMIGVLSMLTSTQFTDTDLRERSSTQQAARIAMGWLQRDLTIAGVGLTPMTPVFPLVVPRQDGGVTIRYNRNATTALITANVTSTDKIDVPANLGLGVGNQLIIYDNNGAFDVTTVKAKNQAGTQLTVEPSLTRMYQTADGTAVSRVEQIDYWLEESVLRRQVDGNPSTPVAMDVAAFEVRYLDDQQPPAEFTPETAVSQLRIRVIEARVRVESTTDRFQGRDRPASDLRSHISPRALSISRS